MSSSSKARKKVNRPASKKSLAQNQSPPFEGAYSNPRMVHVLLSLMGKKCQTKVRNGYTYEGIFHTVSPKMDIALNAVHLCDSPDQSLPSNGIDDQSCENGFPKENELILEMKFPAENFVCTRFEDVDLNFAVLEVNEPNGDMMSQQRSSSKGGEKKLLPWVGGSDSVEADPLVIGGLESSGLEGTNGWDASEMFKANEEKYGVVSDYDASLSSYTMRLDIKETEEDSERVARATKLAQEIESSNDHKHRADLELDEGVTEEDKFSAVTRERDQRRDGRGPRDMRDRDGEYGGHRGDKDRGDRDHPSSPQGYRGAKHSDFDQRSRRGRGRDAFSRSSGYPNQNMPSRPAGMGGGPSGGGRNQSMSQMDGGPQGQSGQGKSYRPASSNLPPRFTKTGSQGHTRDDERMRQNTDSGPMHSPYQAPKGQRNQRMPRSNSGRWQPTSPSSEYSHQSHMHPDPAVISSGGGPTLSRTSSSSSNTSAPVQNHRKHLSTSSQEEQPQHPGQHHPHMRQTHSSSSPTGGPVIPNTQQASPRPQPMQPGGPAQQEGLSWASIARGSQKDAVPAKLGPLSSQTISYVIPPDAKFSWRPSPTPGHNFQSPMQSLPSRGVHPNPPMQQVIPSAHQQPQQNVASPPQQQQAMPVLQPVLQLPQQKSSIQGNPRIAQPPIRTHPATPQDSVEQMDKNEEIKVASKKSAGSSQSVSIKNRNDGPIKELQEFGNNFKLSTDINKDQSPATSKPQQRQQPPNAGQQQQPSPVTPRPQSYQNPPAQQQVFQHQTQPHSTYPAAMGHQDHASIAAQHSMGQSPVQISGNQGMTQPPKPHPQSGVTHMHHSQTIAHPHMSQQIPMASPGIQQFASNVPPQATMQQVSPRQIDSRPMLPIVDKSAMSMQKPLTSPKSDVSNFNVHMSTNGNVHVVTGKPVPQTTPSAVISVSAAAPSPLITSQYHPVTVTANSQPGQQPVKQSPTTVQVLSSPSSTPSVEPAANQLSAAAVASTTTLTSPKQLNPEAMEFKPRTPAKPAPTAARAITPLQQGYVAAYQPQVIQQPSQLVGQMYNPGQVQQIDQMPTVSPMYQTLAPQPFLIHPPVVQQIPGQQMQQFATFDQSAQAYPGHGPQPMMPQNARMAGLPATPQAHVQQYTPDQSPNAVYAVPVPQQPNFMQQARPHSAHTPTKVTAASPAGQSAQQAPQQTGQATQAMVQGPAGQQQMWMMVPPGQIPHQHMSQAPPNAPFMSVVPTPMPSSVAQQKVQQQTIQYMPQHSGRAQYAQFQSSAPNNQ